MIVQQHFGMMSVIINNWMTDVILLVSKKTTPYTVGSLFAFTAESTGKLLLEELFAVSTLFAHSCSDIFFKHIDSTVDSKTAAVYAEVIKT